MADLIGLPENLIATNKVINNTSKGPVKLIQMSCTVNTYELT